MILSLQNTGSTKITVFVFNFIDLMSTIYTTAVLKKHIHYIILGVWRISGTAFSAAQVSVRCPR